MACLTCLRRKKPCDDKRPRCSPCKSSHLRCSYDRPPRTLTFLNEYVGTVINEEVISRDKSVFSPTHKEEIGGSIPTSYSLESENVQTQEQDISQSLGFGSSISPYSSPWHDDFYQAFNLDASPYLDFAAFDEMIQLPGTYSQVPVISTSQPNGDIHRETPTPHSSISNMSGEERPAKKTKISNLPDHILAQHFSRKLTGKYSSKSADWTFYTYFFHRFTRSHPWVLSSMLAWTSAHLCYSSKAEDLDGSLRHYSYCVSYMKRQYGLTPDDLDTIWPSEYEPARDDLLASASADDIDALFVGLFFLALFDLMAARTHQLRKILRFISHVLRIPQVKGGMGGVRSRVASWFCILDGKASAFMLGDGAVLDAIGGEDGLVAALDASYSTLQQAYSLTYPDEERKGDEAQLPLLRRMLCLTSLLHKITRLKHEELDLEQVEKVRRKIDNHRDAIQQIEETQTFQGRSRSTFLVLSALYNSVEISFSRNLDPNQPRHAASAFARKIIQISQKLNELHISSFHGSPSSPPPTKFWPLPLVMAAIEVDDMVYREWTIDRFKKYEETGGDHYVWARKFVEAVCEKEDKTGTRLDWEPIIAEIKDGLVI